MTDTIEIKKVLKTRLKQHFRSKWVQKMVEASGYTPGHIRKYFSSDICNPAIAEKAKEVVDQALREEKEFLEKIKS